MAAVGRHRKARHWLHGLASKALRGVGDGRRWAIYSWTPARQPVVHLRVRTSRPEERQLAATLGIEGLDYRRSDASKLLLQDIRGSNLHHDIAHEISRLGGFDLNWCLQADMVDAATLRQQTHGGVVAIRGLPPGAVPR